MSLVQMSFTGAVMILAVVFIRSMFIHKLPKKTFMILWGIVLIRLLLPFHLPSPLSIYSFAGESARQIKETKNVSTVFLPSAVSMDPDKKIKAESLEETEAAFHSKNAAYTFSPWMILQIVWMAGVMAGVLYFAGTYIQCRKEFRFSLPVEYKDTRLGAEGFLFRRPVSIRQSDRIVSPLTYGVFRPVILMPKQTDWKDKESLQYILTHELIHIRRYDAVIKLILAAALCIHWFNPLVWAMFFLANRDIELSCDEAVIRLLGSDRKSSYALTLIGMEEKKGGWIPLGSSFSKNAVEERIISIMKSKKASAFTVLLAAFLVTAVIIFLGTSYSGGARKIETVPDTIYTEKEYDRLSELIFQNWEDMTVSEYQEKVWSTTDNQEDMELLERFTQDEKVMEVKDSNSMASYFLNILDPLRAERWKERDFTGVASVGDENTGKAELEYWYRLTIKDKDRLTAGEYRNTQLKIEGALQSFMERKTTKELYNNERMEDGIKEEKERLEKICSSDLLAAEVYAVYHNMQENMVREGLDKSENEFISEGRGKTEPRLYPYAGEEDYRLVLALMTPDYRNRSVLDFNEAVLECVEKMEYEQFQGILEDIGSNVYQADLSEEEILFLSETFSLSNNENAYRIRSLQTGIQEEDPWCMGNDLLKETPDGGAWCSLWYQFSYHIADKELLTVEERDWYIGGFRNEIRQFFEKADLEELLLMTEKEVVSYMQEAAKKYSNERITILVEEEQVAFEHLDERELMYY